MTFQKIKERVNTLSEEHLQEEAYVSMDDNGAVKIGCLHITEEDEYFDHTDPLGTLEMIKEENPDDWEDIVEGATLVKKGTIMFIAE